jgi:hypothetical protein
VIDHRDTVWHLSHDGRSCVRCGKMLDTGDDWMFPWQYKPWDYEYCSEKKPEYESLPEWAKPLMRHVRNFCRTHCGSDNPGLLRMLRAWDALTDEQRKAVEP